MTTQEQIIANQSNAERSTGPINTENTKFNAIKHGILSSKIVIENIENLQEYNEFLESFIRDLNPENSIQEAIVEKIVIDFWRLQRLLRYEKAKIRERFGPLNTFHRTYVEQSLKNAVMDAHERTIKELESARNEQNQEKIRELETQKLVQEDTIRNFRNLEEEAESRMFPSFESAELIMRYETSIERSITRKLELLQSLKNLGSLSKKGGPNG